MEAFFNHPSLASPFFRVVDVLEVDLDLGEEQLTWRIELLQATDDSTTFRYRAWDLESFTLHPSFPQDTQGQPLHSTSDAFFVARPFPKIASPGTFQADSPGSALRIALADLRRSLEHMKRQDPQILPSRRWPDA
jgi:hypothetical protein